MKIFSNSFKILVVTWFLLVPYNISFAKVVTKITGRTMVAEFHINSADSLTIESVECDFKEAIIKANNRRVKALIITYADHTPAYIIVGKNNLARPTYYIDMVKKDIENMESREFIQGELIKISKVQIHGPQYRSETYLNGKRIDSYVSNWSSGWFAPKQSVYTSGSDTYVTKTFYVDAEYTDKPIYADGTVIITPGIENFKTRMYFIDN